MFSMFRKKARATSSLKADEDKNEGIFSLHRYLDANGDFDYDLYRTIQMEANKKKIQNVWVQRENIEFLAQYILDRGLKPTIGLCHGTRRGLEQKWFRESLNCEVIGTEISDTATQFESTIQWDFHEVKEEWISSIDFIYSNSLDHSYDPRLCLHQWTKCLKPGGVLLVEHTEGHEKAKETDPFGVKLELFPYLVLLWGRGEFFVTEILECPKDSVRGNGQVPTKNLVIERRSAQ